MTREELFTSDRNERAIYNKAIPEYEVPVPLTNDGFEALLETAAALYNLPIDDTARQTVAVFIHHLAPEENLITVDKIAKVIYKSCANQLTWEIDQGLKAKKQAERIKMLEEAQRAEEGLKLAPNVP